MRIASDGGANGLRQPIPLWGAEGVKQEGRRYSGLFDRKAVNVLVTASGQRAQRQAPPRLALFARDYSSSCNAFRATRLAVRNPRENERPPQLRGPLLVFSDDFIFSAWALFLGHWILGARGKAFVVFQGFLGELDGFLKLRVVAGDHEIRPLRHNEVWIHTVILHDPFATVVH